MRTYEQELDVLNRTYQAASLWESYVPRTARRVLSEGTPLFVGAGGSAAVSQLGVQLHEKTFGVAARALSPLEYLSSSLRVPGPVVLVSDSMSHPDIIEAAERAQRESAVIVLTNREADELRVEPGRELWVITCPRPGRDGYVATNSVLSLSLGLLGLYREDGDRAPTFAEWFETWGSTRLPSEDAWYLDHEELLCVYSPDLRNAAVDFETRLAESGLGVVQLADLRNLAHGRHVGIAKRRDRQAVLVMASRPWWPLAEATASLLPGWIERRSWSARAPWPYCCIEMLMASFGFLGVRARRRGCDPGNPEVHPFGTALFTMSLKGRVPATTRPPFGQDRR